MYTVVQEVPTNSYDDVITMDNIATTILIIFVGWLEQAPNFGRPANIAPTSQNIALLYFYHTPDRTKL